MGKNFSQLTEEFSQNQEIEWLDLEIAQQADGTFVGYESHTHSLRKGNWATIRLWIDYLLADIEGAIKGEEIG